MDQILPQENNKVSSEYERNKNIESDIDENDIYQIDNISLDDKKENKEWSKHAFGSELENTYEIEIQNGMTCIKRNKLNKLAEYNLLHDILNTPKHTKKSNRHYYHIIKGCMNTRKGKAKFKNFQILLDSGFSPTIVIGRLRNKLNPEKGDLIQWYIQADKITTNIKETLPELSATKTVTWNCHMDYSTKSRYDMILGR